MAVNQAFNSSSALYLSSTEKRRFQNEIPCMELQFMSDFAVIMLATGVIILGHPGTQHDFYFQIHTTNL